MGSELEAKVCDFRSQILITLTPSQVFEKREVSGGDRHMSAWGLGDKEKINPHLMLIILAPSSSTPPSDRKRYRAQKQWSLGDPA